MKCAYVENHNGLVNALYEFKKSGRVYATEFLANLSKEHWENAYFEGKQYGDICSNVVESFNAWILKEWFLPITTYIDKV